MSRPEIDARRPLLPSLLDRLADDDPDRTSEAQASSYQVLEEYRQALRRDLEDLLNTRASLLLWPEHTDHALLSGSSVNYGIPDATGKNVAGREAREEFLRSVQGVIRRFEPRFLRCRVVGTEDPDPAERSLHFRIEGRIRAQPAPEDVVYDSRLEPETRSFSVSAG